MEETGREYNDRKMEEMEEKYPKYEGMKMNDLGDELLLLKNDFKKGETGSGREDINEEITFVRELRRVLVGRNFSQWEDVGEEGGEDLTREQLEKTYPYLSDLSYNELVSMENRLLDDMLASGKSEDRLPKKKVEELRYIKILQDDYQRESDLTKIFDTGDTKRELVKQDDNRKLELFKKWARENTGILSIILISSASVIVGLIATARNILWKVGDTTGKLDKRISELLNNQVGLPYIFRVIAGGVELAADNIWIIITCAAVILLYKYKYN